MKKRTKLVGLILLAALLTATFSGCSYEEEYVPVDTQTDVLQNTENSNSTVSIPNLTQNLPVNGEDFSLICKYDTGKYSLKNWHVTDTKSINMNVHTKNLPDGYDVMVEHMHADISLVSTSPQITVLHKIPWIILSTETPRMVLQLIIKQAITGLSQ